MKNQSTLIAVLAGAAGLAAYYFISRKNASVAPRPISSGGGGSGSTLFPFNRNIPAPVNSQSSGLTNQLAQSGASLASSLLSSLLGAKGGSSGGGGGGGVGGAVGGGSRITPQGGDGVPALGSPIISGQTSFYNGYSGSAFDAPGISLVSTNANLGDLIGNPATYNFGANDFGGELNSTAVQQAPDLSTVDLSGSSADFAGEGG